MTPPTLPTSDDPREIAGSLNGPQRKLMTSLPDKLGHYIVGGLRGLSWRSLSGLRAFGLLDEQWTWASIASPDVGCSPLGLQVRAILLEEAGRG